MNVLEKILFQLALTVALRRPMPSRYSLAADSPRSQHFIGAAIEDATEPKLRFVVQKRWITNTARFEGRYFSADMEESVEGCILLNWLSNSSLRIPRVYGPLQFDYSSVYEFLFHSITLKHLRAFRRQQRDQRHFNRNFRFSAELAETLRKLVQWQEEKAKESGDISWHWSFHHLDALNSLYPPEIWGHGENNYFCLRFKFALDALVENGELEKVTGEASAYKVSPKALQKLSDVEVENSRHRDSASLTRWLVILTAVIAFFAMIEAFQN